MKLSKDLREFIELLNSAEIDYVIVGGHAVAYHGHPRYTGDIDFFVRPDASTAHKLVLLLKRFGFDDADLVPEDLAESDQVIQLGRVPYRIDILTGITGVTFEEAFASRISAKLDGLPVWIIARDPLLKNKRATGRLKDAADVEELE